MKQILLERALWLSGCRSSISTCHQGTTKRHSSMKLPNLQQLCQRRIGSTCRPTAEMFRSWTYLVSSLHLQRSKRIPKHNALKCNQEWKMHSCWMTVNICFVQQIVHAVELLTELFSDYGSVHTSGQIHSAIICTSYPSRSQGKLEPLSAAFGEEAGYPQGWGWCVCQ